MTASEELWKPLVGFGGAYLISSHGRVQSIDRQVRHRCGGTRLQRGRLLVLSADSSTGYLKVSISLNGKAKTFAVHSLVAEAFIGPRPSGMQVAHKDGVRTNATVCNLRYDTQAGNEKDKITHGTVVRGMRVHNAKLSDADVAAIRKTTHNQRETAEQFGVSQPYVSELRSFSKRRSVGASHE